MKLPKLFYTPGLISLLGLPLLLLFLFPWPKPQNSLRMFLPSDEKTKDNNPHIRRYTRYNVLEDIKKKKIIQVQVPNLGYDEYEYYIHNEALKFINCEIKRLTFTNDTNSVLKVTMANDTRYGDFVGILNNLLLYKVKHYALVDNSLFIFANEPPEEPELVAPIFEL
jgi:hypothetical protein